MNQKVGSLNTIQTSIFTTVVDSIEKQMKEMKYVTSASSLRLVVSGTAGTGKSYLIETIADYLVLNHKTPKGRSIVLIAASTGKAAFQIKGNTVHSLLSIPPTSLEYNPLKNDKLNEMKLRFSHCRLIIVDEISLISNEMLVKVRLRLQEIGDTTLPFGGYNLLFFGDLLQLPPVKAPHVFLEG